MADRVNKRKGRSSLRSVGGNVEPAGAKQQDTKQLNAIAQAEDAAPSGSATPAKAVTDRKFETQAMTRLLSRLTDPEIDLQDEIRIIGAYCRLKREKTAKLKVGKLGGKRARTGSGQFKLQQPKSPVVENDRPDAENEARELETLSQAVQRIYGVEMPK